jgi:hypothetical protein
VEGEACRRKVHQPEESLWGPTPWVVLPEGDKEG